MRCIFGFGRMENVSHTDTSDILMLSDCRPRGIRNGEFNEINLEISLNDAERPPFSLVYATCVTITAI